MGLYGDLKITSGPGHMIVLGGVEIIRQEPLDNRERPDDEVHSYKASIWKSGEIIRGPIFFRHRYGDGAWTCLKKALEGLGQ